MDEIKLSLDATADDAVEAAAITAAEMPEAPAAPVVITPVVPANLPDFTAVADTASLMPDSSALTDAEKKTVADFAQKIDIKNSAQVLQYGGNAQKKISAFSEQALANVRTKEMDEIGDMVSGLVVQLKNFEIEDKGKKPGLFKKQRDKFTLAKAKYDTVEKNVDKICGVLEGHKLTLMKDVAMLDQMYEKNLDYYKELTMYVIAGRQKLQDVIEKELPALQKKAIESGLPEDAQAANYLADMCNRFDKKLHDLELTRVISIQMSPQIRLVQSTNSIMIEKIHTSIVNTIPLWKNQMVLALGMAHSKQAIRAQKEVSDITNDLLKKNADALKINTIEAARESERSIVEIETLRHTNQSLISTLDEVLQIQQTGREKRKEAQAELYKIEEELKTKLLDIRDAGKTNMVEAKAEKVEDGALTLEG